MPLTPEDEIRTRDELVAFVRELHEDYVSRGHDWENHTLDRFLEALAAWMASSDGWYWNAGKDLPADGDWTFIARALKAATRYE
ncbi:DUF7660 family protein [Streptomyces solicathayae]|uniref:DUF7660 domain-containing protein n=1 Tax=Streptomyces solicathayae TaxID=3081768 RepID=A0ABZ0M5R6_9ACTN|nr:hypothetical protein [Streptomyces sp. HUAS YS2]WOX26428.1 hypothetical protein R2D22_35660 [Streptomyces sp. HUAS YS2]